MPANGPLTRAARLSTPRQAAEREKIVNQSIPTRMKLFNYSMLALATACGAGALILFAAGSFHAVRMRWPEVVVLFWDGLLSLAFFLQHSGMVRRPFRARLAGVIPPHYHGAIYSIASGVALTMVIELWQPSETHLLTFQGLPRWIIQGCSVLTVAGFAWCIVALRSFDPFGLAPIVARLRGNPDRPSTFVVRGPYRWVRHPLYFCLVVLIWSSPDLSADRLLFSVLWTAWIYVGTTLEEADLLAEFGDAYRDYRRKVPMFIPWRIGVQSPYGGTHASLG